MAIIVANAMTKEEKASAENKALIEKLAKEFADELQALGARVSTLEKNPTNSTILVSSAIGMTTCKKKELPIKAASLY